MKSTIFIIYRLTLAMGFLVAVISSCDDMQEFTSCITCEEQNSEESHKNKTNTDCNPAPTVETWTKDQYNAFGTDYKGSAKVEIAPGITLEKTKANDHELVFNDVAACTITLAVKNGNVYKAFTFNTQCADNYIFKGKDVSGIKYGAFDCTPCECQEVEYSGDDIITFTQAYYVKEDFSVHHYAGYNIWDYDDNTNHKDKGRTQIQSIIWTVNGTPAMGRFFLNFDLSDYNNTGKTLIENTLLYLYAHPTYENHSSNKTNRHVFNRIIGDWQETLTWNNQPEVDVTTSVVTDHIPGTFDEPRRDDYVFNLDDILLENGKLMADYNGISCRPYKEDINDYYRRVTFASRNFGVEALFPTLKIQYVLPLPVIKFENEIFRVTNNDDLKALFKNVQYKWTINGEENTGESFRLESASSSYNVQLQIIITNNIGEISEHNISRTFCP